MRYRTFDIKARYSPLRECIRIRVFFGPKLEEMSFSTGSWFFGGVLEDEEAAAFFVLAVTSMMIAPDLLLSLHSHNPFGSKLGCRRHRHVRFAGGGLQAQMQPVLVKTETNFERSRQEHASMFRTKEIAHLSCMFRWLGAHFRRGCCPTLFIQGKPLSVHTLQLRVMGFRAQFTPIILFTQFS